MATTKHAVLIDTNLNTHLALMITDIDTVEHLKKNIVLEHLKCFPTHSNIAVNAIKVKRKKCFYHLSDSVPVKSVFQRVTGTWFLYVDAVSLKEIDAENHRKQALEPEKLLAAHVTSVDLAVKPVETSVNEKKKKKKIPARTQQVKSIPTLSGLKRKLSEASLAKVVSTTSIKKKRSTKVSDAETGLLNSGVGKDDSTSDVVPVTSKSEKALVAGQPSLETEKAGENKKKENIPLKKVIRSSTRKAAAAASNNNSPKCVPKDGKAGGKNSEIPSGILEHNMEKSYLECLNGRTNEDPISSAAEVEGVDFIEHFLPKDHKIM
ncbi:hypothetical protein MKW92_033115 [Papaver armeniacum]|nr:hypothetical protein MKW92_033115 [Papaver armeniacum]